MTTGKAKPVQPIGSKAWLRLLSEQGRADYEGLRKAESRVFVHRSADTGPPLWAVAFVQDPEFWAAGFEDYDTAEEYAMAYNRKLGGCRGRWIPGDPPHLEGFAFLGHWDLRSPFKEMVVVWDEHERCWHFSSAGHRLVAPSYWSHLPPFPGDEKP